MKRPIAWRAVLGRLGLFILAFAGMAAIAVTPVATVLDEWATANPTYARLYFDITGALAIFAATWVMTTFLDRRAFPTIGFAPQHVGRDLSRGLAIGTAWLGISVGLTIVAGWASPQNPTGLSGSLLLIAAASALFNTLTQQLLLCGYILQTISAKAGFPAAMIVSALLFSAYHAAGFHGAWIPPINVFAAGLVFCLAYGITGNLWLPTAIHFAWNMLLGPVLGLTVSGTGTLGLGWNSFEIEGPDIFTGGAFGLEGGLIVTFTTTILVVILLLIYRRKSVFASDAGSGSSSEEIESRS